VERGLQALSMETDLTVPALLRRTRAHFGDKRVLVRRTDGGLHRTTYAEVLARADRLSAALTRLGVKPGEPVATLCWNHDRHLEAYFAVSAIGAVLHTLNLRLHPDELAYIATDAGDRVLLVDEELLPLLEGFRARAPIRQVIVIRNSDAALAPGDVDYEALLADAGPAAPPELEVREHDAAAMCYTSGTTGRAKGVVYSHRCIVLHSLMLAMSDLFGLGERDVVLPAVALFHANAWGLPYAAPLVGSDLVLPGRQLDARTLLDLLVEERVTFTAGVPTVWLPLLELLDKAPVADLSALRLLVIGGAALPESLLRGLTERHGIPAVHSWGMTELAPVGTLARLPSRLDGAGPAERLAAGLRQGTPGALLEIRARSDAGLIPWDDTAVGELEVRGPTVSAGYHGLTDIDDRFTADGWFRTGDVVSIDQWGSIRIRDRAKDLVKSGGEWISSVALENRLMSHPAVLEAAVVAVPHPTWLERPLGAVVLRPGHAPDVEALKTWIADAFPRWWVPEALVFVDAIPRTSTGKFLKTRLREQFAGWYEASTATDLAP
jgi:acyl-CoA synthetase (AMP-forming)/AMP-acid ligase II